MKEKWDECAYCEEPINGKAYWNAKLDGWVCEECDEIIKDEYKK